MSSEKDNINELIRQSLQRRTGVSSHNYNKLQQNKKFKTVEDHRYVNKHVINSPKQFNKISSPRKQFKNLIRSNFKDFKFSTIKSTMKRLDLQHGCFNGCIIKNKFKDNEYICAYRENEENIYLCRLDYKFDIIPLSLFSLDLYHSADPRLIWTKDNELLMIYSFYEEKMESEHILGRVVLDSANKYLINKPFRISPRNLNSRQKNWVPFIHNNNIYFIGEIKPHTIYKMNDLADEKTELVYAVDWESKWFNSSHMRGSTPPVLFNNDTFLSTFHTVETHGNVHFYDNGFYLFKSTPPFNVIKCAYKTFLPAESACEPYFRKHEHIVCPFPIGMVVEEENLHISYGDNDSSIKILSTTINEAMSNLGIA
jgi:predicted GH43/DUF377 family glycosyl hydrolase